MWGSALKTGGRPGLSWMWKLSARRQDGGGQRLRQWADAVSALRHCHVGVTGSCHRGKRSTARYKHPALLTREQKDLASKAAHSTSLLPALLRVSEDGVLAERICWGRIGAARSDCRAAGMSLGRTVRPRRRKSSGSSLELAAGRAQRLPLQKGLYLGINLALLPILYRYFTPTAQAAQGGGDGAADQLRAPPADQGALGLRGAAQGRQGGRVARERKEMQKRNHRNVHWNSGMCRSAYTARGVQGRQGGRVAVR